MKIIDPTRVSPFFYDCIDSGIHVNLDKGDLIDEDYINADFSIGLQYFPYSNEYLIWALASSHFGTSELKNYSIFFPDDEYSKSRQVLNLLSEFHEKYYYGYYSNDFDIALSSLLDDFESKSLDKIDISSYLSHAETTEDFGFFKTRISCNFESSNYKDDRVSFDSALYQFLTDRVFILQFRKTDVGFTAKAVIQGLLSEDEKTGLLKCVEDIGLKSVPHIFEINLTQT